MEIFVYKRVYQNKIQLIKSLCMKTVIFQQYNKVDNIRNCLSTY